MITTSPLEIHVCICVSVIKMPVTLCPFHCITRFRIIIPYCMFCYTCTVLIVLCEIGNKFWFDRHPQLSQHTKDTCIFGKVNRRVDFLVHHLFVKKMQFFSPRVFDNCPLQLVRIQISMDMVKVCVHV